MNSSANVCERPDASTNAFLTTRSKQRVSTSIALFALKRIWFLAIALLLLCSVKADQHLSIIGAVTKGLIELNGTYELIIPRATIEADALKYDLYLNNEEVVFSDLITTRVRWVRIEAPVSAGDPFRVSTYAAEAFSSKLQAAGQGIPASQALGQYKARLAHGLRGPYCSLEISGKLHEKVRNGRVFNEYYLVLGVGLGDEQSLWLGPTNTPADAAGGKDIRVVLVKVAN